MRTFIFSTSVLLLIIFLFPISSYSQYKIDRFVWGSGSGNILGANNGINGTLGQSFTGTSVSGQNQVNSGFWYSYSQVTAVEDVNLLPDKYMLYQNYPNPFNPVTRIKYDLPQESLVLLKIYNTLGEEVAVLINQLQHAGVYEVDWDAAGYASGFYICRIDAGNYVSIKKLVLLK